MGDGVIERTWACEACKLEQLPGAIAHLVSVHGFPDGERMLGKRLQVMHLDLAGGEWRSLYRWTLERTGAPAVVLFEAVRQLPRARATRERARRG